MAPVKCEQCGNEFESEQALEIHKGQAHGAKPKVAKRRKARRAGAVASAAKGAAVCDICGRSFKLVAHLARHKSTTHKTAVRRKPVRTAPARVVRRAAPKAKGVKVESLSIDELLSLKSAVDARLADIVQMMRKAKVNL